MCNWPKHLVAALSWVEEGSRPPVALQIGVGMAAALDLPSSAFCLEPWAASQPAPAR